MNTSPPSDSTIYVGAIGALLSLLVTITLGYVARINSKQDKQSETQAEHGTKLAVIETVLTGATGDNGLVGDVIELKRRTSELDRRIGEVDRRHPLQLEPRQQNG